LALLQKRRETVFAQKKRSKFRRRGSLYFQIMGRGPLYFKRARRQKDQLHFEGLPEPGPEKRVLCFGDRGRLTERIENVSNQGTI
jgi:hypothetical protein